MAKPGVATSGPTPKRSSETVGHRAKADRPDQVDMPDTVEMPPVEEDWCHRATEWYISLGKSGQSKYYEPSDWEYARLLADLLTQQICKERGPGSEMMKGILSEMGRLGTTEYDRRRMRIEINRDLEEGVNPADVAVMEKYRKAAYGK